MHEATFRWVDELMAAEYPEMTRINIGGLSRFYLTRPGSSRRLHHDLDGCVADQLAATGRKRPPHTSTQTSCGSSRSDSWRTALASGRCRAPRQSWGSRCCDLSSTTSHASGCYGSDTTRSPSSPTCSIRRGTPSSAGRRNTASCSFSAGIRVKGILRRTVTVSERRTRGAGYSSKRSRC